MTTSAAEKIERWHADLPAVLRAAVEGLPIYQIILDIGKHHGLTIERLGFLAEEIARFVSGRTDAAGFLSSLQSALGGNRTQTAAVAREVNAKVFAKIHEALRGASAAIPPLAVQAPAPPPASSQLQRGEPPTRPIPPPSAPEAKAPPAVPGKPEPLIIRPLPSPSPIPPGGFWTGKPPRETAAGGQRTPPQAVPSATGQVADGEQPVVANAAAPAPPVKTPSEKKLAVPPVMVKPAPPPAPKAPEAVPPRMPETPAPPRLTAREPTAPIISPLGMRPPQAKREVKNEEPGQQDSETPKQAPPVPVVPPSTPPKSEPYQPPPPAQAYERAREAFQRELASAAAGRPTAQPETKPVSGVSAPPAPLGTKEALQLEIEKFRQTAGDSEPRTPQQAVPPATGQIVVGAPNAPSPSPTVPKPLKLPTEKIPKPPAPTNYTVDPYKEPPE